MPLPGGWRIFHLGRIRNEYHESLTLLDETSKTITSVCTLFIAWNCIVGLTRTLIERKRAVLAVIGLMILAGVVPQRASANADGKYNVLYIIADDLNDYVSALGGHPLVETPNLDRLAKTSITFTNAQTNAGWCAPSRASFMTGVAPWHSGIVTAMPLQQRVLKHCVSLPAYFKSNGYYAETEYDPELGYMTPDRVNASLVVDWLADRGEGLKEPFFRQCGFYPTSQATVYPRTRIDERWPARRRTGLPHRHLSYPKGPLWT